MSAEKADSHSGESQPEDKGSSSPDRSRRRRRLRKRVPRLLLRQLRRFVLDDEFAKAEADDVDNATAAAVDGDAADEIRRRTAPTGLVGRCRDLHHQAALIQRRLEADQAAPVAMVAYQRRGRHARRFGNVALLGLQESSSSSSSSSSIEELPLDNSATRQQQTVQSARPPMASMAPRGRFYDVLEGCRRSEAFGARFDLDRCRCRFQLVARRRVEPPGAGLSRLAAWERLELVRCAVNVQLQFGLRRCSLQVPRGIGAGLALADQRDISQGLIPCGLVLVPEMNRYLEAFRYACNTDLVPGWPNRADHWLGPHWPHPCRDPKSDAELYEKNVILTARADVQQRSLDPVLAVTPNPPTEHQMKQLQQAASRRPNALARQQEEQQKRQKRQRQLQQLANYCPTYKGFMMLRHPTQPLLLGFCSQAAESADNEDGQLGGRRSPEELLALLEVMDSFVDDVLLGDDANGGSGGGGGCQLNVSLDCAYHFPKSGGSVFGCLQLPPAAAAAFNPRSVYAEQQRPRRTSPTKPSATALSVADSRPQTGQIFVDPDYEKEGDTSRCSVQ